MQLEDNNTNRLWKYSADGLHWIQVYSESRTSFITPDEIGFYVEESGNAYSAAMTLLSWVEA